MKDVHPAVLGGIKAGTRLGGVGTAPERSAGKEIPRNEGNPDDIGTDGPFSTASTVIVS